MILSSMLNSFIDYEHTFYSSLGEWGELNHGKHLLGVVYLSTHLELCISIQMPVSP